MKILTENYDKVNNSNLASIDKARILLRDCKKYGTLSFAHLARSAFIAVSLLNGAKNKKIISKEAINGFYQSLNTINQNLKKMLKQLEMVN